MDFYLDLKAEIGGTVRADEPLRKHTTWRIGGPADYFVQPSGVADLQFVLRYAAERKLPLIVLGNGSNLLVSDDGFRGMLVKLAPGMDQIVIDGDIIRAGGGAGLSRLIRVAGENNLGGLEFMAGIPASVGGAVVMNAGANGASVGDRVEEVTVIDRRGMIHRRPGTELGFRYRRSNLQDGDAIVTEVVFRCIPRERAAIRGEVERYLRRRRETQPLEYPSAGCVFRNPPGDSAGRLIDAAGGKGLKVGGAQVSHKHANFILNMGGASALDVKELIRLVRRLVSDKFGVELELEVNLMDC